MIDLSKLLPSVSLRLPKMVIYGPKGIGKSDFCAQIPDVIVMDVENGMDSFYVPKYKISKYDQIREFLIALYKQPHSFKYLVVDSADWVQDLMSESLCTQFKAATLSDRGCSAFLFGEGYKKLGRLWGQFLSSLSALNRDRNMGIILTAHPQIRKFEDPLSSSYDQYSLKIDNVGGEKLKEWADAVLFATFRVNINEEKGDFGSVVKRGADGVRVLHTQPNACYEAKNRFGLPPTIPFEKNKSWQSFFHHFQSFQKSIEKKAAHLQEPIKKNSVPPIDIPSLPVDEAPVEFMGNATVENVTEEVTPISILKAIPQTENATIPAKTLINEFQVDYLKRLMSEYQIAETLTEYNVYSLSDLTLDAYNEIYKKLCMDAVVGDDSLS